MRGWCGRGGPEEGVVVGEEGEEDSEEEGCGCLGVGRRGVSGGVEREGAGEGLVRQRIMKVAKDWERFPIAMLESFVSVVRLKLKEGLRQEFILKPASYDMSVRRSLSFGIVDYALKKRNYLGISIVD